MSPVPLDPRRSWLGFLLAAAGALALFLTLLDPAPSAGRGAAGRLLFWAFHVAGALALCQAATAALTRGAPRLPEWGAVVLGGVLGGALFAPAAALYDAAVPSGAAERLSLGDLLAEAAALVPPAALAWTAFNGVRFLRLHEAPAGPRTAERPAFLLKSKRGLPGAVVSLSAELHYLRVRTEGGEDLILHPFGAAVAAMPEGAGLQVHRSHWVALDAIEDVRARGTAGVARLRGGTEVPVARSRLAALRRALATARAEAPTAGAGALAPGRGGA